MSTTRTARRFITLSASVALIASAPGLVGVASATNTPSPVQGTSHSQSTMSPDLVKAVQVARDAFKATARQAFDTYRAAKLAMHTAIEATLKTQHDALNAARDALMVAHAAGTETAQQWADFKALKDAYHAAKDAATVTWLATNADPKVALKTAIDGARVTYTSAIKTAFAAFAPTTAIPNGLLEAPGKGHGHAFGHLQSHKDQHRMHVSRV